MNQTEIDQCARQIEITDCPVCDTRGCETCYYRGCLPDLPAPVIMEWFKDHSRITAATFSQIIDRFYELQPIKKQGMN